MEERPARLINVAVDALLLLLLVACELLGGFLRAWGCDDDADEEAS
jgi:hypothetical protein